MAEKPCSPCEARRRAAAEVAQRRIAEIEDVGWLTDADDNRFDFTNPIEITDGELVLATVRQVPNVWPTRTPDDVSGAFYEPQSWMRVGAKFVARINRATRSHSFVNGYFSWLAEVNEQGEIVANWHGATPEMLADQSVAVHPGWGQ